MNLLPLALNIALTLCLASSAYQVPPTTAPYNPFGIWQARHALLPPPLCLPATQRGMRSQQTYLHYRGRQFLLQQLYYSKQGLLDSCFTYEVVAIADSLTSYPHVRARYHTRLLSDSLVSEEQDSYAYYPFTGWSSDSSDTATMTGKMLFTEPLLDAAKPLLTAGHLQRATSRDTATWRWTPAPAAGSWEFSFHWQDVWRSHTVSWQAILDPRARKLTVGGGCDYVRQYALTGPDYVEQCRCSSALAGTGGGSLVSNVYHRTTFWQAGLCRREHFVVLDDLPGAEFDVVYSYTFYRFAHRAPH